MSPIRAILSVPFFYNQDKLEQSHGENTRKEGEVTYIDLAAANLTCTDVASML